MIRQVRLTDGARRDLRRLAAFLDEHNPPAARRAAATLASGLLSLREYAERGRAHTENYRELHVKFGRQGYFIRYRVLADEVLVLRIFHALETR